VQAARSLRADYNLTKKPAEFYVVCADAAALAHAKDARDDFTTLASASAVHCAVDGGKGKGSEPLPPPGCGVKIVNDALRVYVNLQGMVDFAAEVAKLEKQTAKLAPLIDKLEKKLADPQYMQKASEKNRADDAAKLAQYKTQHDVATTAIAQYAAPAADDDDDMDDMFGDDDDDGAPKEMNEGLLKLKAAAEARLAKKEAAQRMMVVMEVKPWEAEQDLTKLWKKLTTEVAPEGLKWGEGCNLVDVAFGIKKIVMSCVVNMTVSTDDVVEQMQETYEDEVQSIDVISMNVL